MMGSGPCLPRFAELPKLPSVFLLFVSGSRWRFEFVGAAIGDDFFTDSVGLVFPVFGSDNSGIDGDYGSQPLLTGMLRDFRNFD